MSTNAQVTPKLQQQIYSLGFTIFRQRRRKLAKRTLPFETSETLLDIGGYPQFWEEWGVKAKITCLNTDKIESNTSNLRYAILQADGCDTGLPNLSYDICFSNSVIEHVGGHERQVDFAREVRRLAPAYWVQTPNRHFFLETHVLGPCLHWLKKGKLRRFLCRYFSVWGLLKKPGNDEIDEFIDALTLLTEQDLQALFPDARIVREKFLFMTKSLIAYRLGV